MENIVLKLNDVCFSVPIDGTGTFSVSNNADGNKMVCMIIRNAEVLMYEEILLKLGMSIEIKYLSGQLIEDSSEMEYYISTEYLDVEDVGIELEMKDRVLSAPFIKNGSLSVMVTVVKGKVIVNFGGITSENELLDFYCGQMHLNDRLRISLKGLEQISKPFNIRKYKNCNF